LVPKKSFKTPEPTALEFCKCLKPGTSSCWQNQIPTQHWNKQHPK